MNRQKQIKIYKKILQGLFSVLNFFFLNPINLWVFEQISMYGYGSNKCLKKGFLPIPVHFYSPIPDIEDLKKRKIWAKKSELRGINFNLAKQLELMASLGYKFGKECHWPVNPTENPADFHIDNAGFSFGCAAVLYTMIREFKPKKIIEIGSGYSSKIIVQAIDANGNKCHYTIIDPYPGSYIVNNEVRSNRLIKKRVELTNPKIFDVLDKNDVLFIDSSHTVKIGSDVNFLLLEILPRLKPGVIIHIHDISLPYEYSKTYATNEHFRQFWTEQYLLQSFLICNYDYEILLSMAYIMKHYLSKFRKAFPCYRPEIHKFTSSSFWIRRKQGK